MPTLHLDVLPADPSANAAVDRAWAETASRAEAVIASAGDWPCRRGCDHCCRSLGDVPRATRVEWARVRAAVADLPDEVRSNVEAHLRELASSSPPYTCPLLDRDAGACLVYAVRPTACRAYGFYVDEDGDARACGQIDREAPVVWGNEVALDGALLRGAGPPVGMLEPGGML